MKVLEYLKEHTLDDLEKEFSIKIRRYEDEGICILNYSMIDSPKFHPIVRECRSLILTNTAPYNVVSRSFSRFFNYGECQESKTFNFEHAYFWEKVDGSIINVYWYNDQWNISTKSMALGEAETPRGDRFSDIFKSVFDVNKIPHEHKNNSTLIFEMVSPVTRVVKPYKKNDVYLLAVRDRVTGLEYHPESLSMLADELGVKLPKYFAINSYEDVQNVIADMDAFDEGFVGAVYKDKYVHRIKFKNPSHLAIAHLRGEGVLSIKRVIMLIVANDEDEYLEYFPEDRSFFQPYIDARERMISHVHDTIEKTRNIEDQKEFALQVKDLPISGLMFQIKKGKSLSDAIDRLSDNSKVGLIEKYLTNT